MLFKFLLALVLFLCLIAESKTSKPEDYLAKLDSTNVCVYPNQYLVSFSEGHTIEEHFDTIGLDLASSTIFHKCNVGSWAVLDEQTRDERVRRDPEVRLVEARGPQNGMQQQGIECYGSPTRTRSTIDPKTNLAPLTGMDDPDRIPYEYLVSFRHKYTLEQHFRAIGRDLSSYPSFVKYGFSYRVTMDDETRDELVRRDPGVFCVQPNIAVDTRDGEEVELMGSLDPEYIESARWNGQEHGRCPAFERYSFAYPVTEQARRDQGVCGVETDGPDYGIELRGVETLDHSDLKPSQSEPGGYLAPLKGMEYERLPNQYIVKFRDGHTHEQHFRTIGQDLSRTLDFVRLKSGYGATLDDRMRDELVRRDPGVLWVEPDRVVYGIEPHEVHDVATVDSSDPLAQPNCNSL